MSQTSTSKSSQDLFELFNSPPTAYRPMVQWSLNGDLNEEHIRQRLRLFAEQGIGGTFAHARQGCITGYLSDRWFELWDFAAREAQRLGLEFQIYDEFCCPAGNAAGQVVAEKPHLVRQELTLSVHTGVGTSPRGQHLAWFRKTGDRFERIEHAAAMSEMRPDKPVYAITLRVVEGRGPADLLRRETTDEFIRITHDGYAKRSADLFGSTVKFMFSDEPHISGAGTGLPFSRDVAREFQKEHGYDVMEKLELLCFGGEGAEALRHDYFSTINRLYLENFVKPIALWCEVNDLLFTGHVMEHEWPSPLSHPNAMAAMRWMHAPGNDLLGFQYEPTTMRANGIWLLNVKELASLANQLGREWTMVESCGGPGYHASFELFKPLEDWLLSIGVNVMDPHLSHETLSGIRKYDWPHTLSEHSPWFSQYRAQADHVASTAAVLSQGKEFNRVLVLHPTSTGWIHYEHPIFGQRKRSETTMKALQDKQVDLLVRLSESQVDYDLGDEYVMAEFARIEGSRLRVGERVYDAVIIPGCMENWTPTTRKVLQDLVAAGGKVLAEGELPQYVNGRPEKTQLTCERPADVVQRIIELVPPRIAPSPGLAGLCWRRAVVNDSMTVWFFCNPWSTTLKGEVELDHPTVQPLDATTVTGIRDNKVALEIPPRGHALLIASTEHVMRDPMPPVKRDPVSAQLKAVTRLDDNLLPIDYCDVRVHGQRASDLHHLRADELHWRAQGFDQNPWRSGYPLKLATMQRYLPDDSEVTVDYRFTCDAALPGIRIGIERPWLYRWTLNGQDLPAESAKPWFDEHFRAFDAGGLLRLGENVLQMSAHPVTILCEIMPIYLIGDFAVSPSNKGFTLAPAKPLSLGDWTTQGCSFYPGRVEYRFAITLDKPANGLEVQLGKWAGTVTTIRVNDNESKAVMHPPFTATLPDRLEPGQHEVVVEVYGNMRNMMGPWHSDGLAGVWTWDRSPEHMPPGSAYHREESGLSEPIKVIALR